jgi:hypothetical protein
MSAPVWFFLALAPSAAFAGSTGHAVETVSCAPNSIQFAGRCRGFDWFSINLSPTDADIEAVYTGPESDDGFAQVILFETSESEQRIVLVSSERVATSASEDRGGYRVEAEVVYALSTYSDDEVVLTEEFYDRTDRALELTAWTETTYFASGYESCNQDGECEVVFYSLLECSTIAGMVRMGAYGTCVAALGTVGFAFSSSAAGTAAALTAPTGPAAVAAWWGTFTSGMGGTAWLIDNLCPRAETSWGTLVEDLLDETDVCDDGVDEDDDHDAGDEDDGGDEDDCDEDTEDMCDDGTGGFGGDGTVVGGEWTGSGGGCEESTTTETLGFVTYTDGWKCTVTYEAEVTVNADCTKSTIRTSDYASVCMPE